MFCSEFCLNKSELDKNDHIGDSNGDHLGDSVPFNCKWITTQLNNKGDPNALFWISA